MARSWRHLLAALAAAAIGAPAPAAADGIVVEPLTFGVQNLNRSEVPCPADGGSYFVRGHLVAPEAVGRQGRDGVTLYLHGGLTGEPTWSLPGQHHALEMAKLGHASITVSQLGFRPSSRPNGYLTCHGSEADVARQVIAQLKNDTLPRPEGLPEFEQVALAGHSGGSFAAEIAAYSFRDLDDVSSVPPDALVLMGNGRVSDVHEAGVEFAIKANLPCAHGGEGLLEGLSQLEPLVGYVFVDIGPGDEHLFFHRVKPSVLDAFHSPSVRDFQPCGPDASVPATQLQQHLVNRIDEPVLIVNGKNDGFFPAGSADDHLEDFKGSPDRTALELSRTGHMLMLERSADDAFRPALSRWLRRRGF